MVCVGRPQQPVRNTNTRSKAGSIHRRVPDTPPCPNADRRGRARGARLPPAHRVVLVGQPVAGRAQPVDGDLAGDQVDDRAAQAPGRRRARRRAASRARSAAGRRPCSTAHRPPGAGTSRPRDQRRLHPRRHGGRARSPSQPPDDDRGADARRPGAGRTVSRHARAVRALPRAGPPRTGGPARAPPPPPAGRTCWSRTGTGSRGRRLWPAAIVRRSSSARSPPSSSSCSRSTSRDAASCASGRATR